MRVEVEAWLASQARAHLAGQSLTRDVHGGSAIQSFRFETDLSESWPAHGNRAAPSGKPPLNLACQALLTHSGHSFRPLYVFGKCQGHIDFRDRHGTITGAGAHSGRRPRQSRSPLVSDAPGHPPTACQNGTGELSRTGSLLIGFVGTKPAKVPPLATFPNQYIRTPSVSRFTLTLAILGSHGDVVVHHRSIPMHRNADWCKMMQETV